MPDKKYPIFGTDGGEKAAAELGVTLLGKVPLEMPVREGGDNGLPIVLSHPESASAIALMDIAQKAAAKISVAALT
jgi:ATP-binding protein involved in chromosome partitioning